MANVYIKTAEGGETTTPTTDHALPLDNGTDSTWISLTNLFKFVASLTGKTTPVGADVLPISDSAASDAAKKVTFTNLAIFVYNYLTSLTAKTAPVIADQLVIADSEASNAAKKVTLDNFYKTINGLAADSSPDTAADYVATYDASAGAAKKVLLGDLGIGGELTNYLDNAGFYRWSRDTDGTFSKAMTDDTYNLPDRWYSLIQGANATLARDTGINGSVYGAKITAGGTTNRYGLAQIVKFQRAKKLRSQTVIFQVRVKPTNNAGSGSRDYRVAILEWTGTADSVTSEIVNDWTSSNYTTGNFFATTSLTLVGTATEAVSHNTEAVISVSGAVSASCNNLIVFVWAEDAPTHASDYAVFGEAGLYIASTEQTWVLPDPGADEANCMKRFISYGGGNAYDMVGIGMNYDTTSAILAVSLPVEMDANPTLAVSAANHWLVRIPGGSQTCTAVSLNVAGKKVLEILATVASGLTAGQGNELFANNTLSARLTLDCDL